MVESIKKLDGASRLLLHRTGREDVKKGISVIVKGEGVALPERCRGVVLRGV